MGVHNKEMGQEVVTVVEMPVDIAQPYNWPSILNKHSEYCISAHHYALMQYNIMETSPII